MQGPHFLHCQQQDCTLTLKQGIQEYRCYLASIERKVMTDKPGSRLILEHDATHVIFGMNTTLEQEAGLDTWLIWGCKFQLSYIMGYHKLPEIKALYKALIREGGWVLFPKIYSKTMGMKWRIYLRTRRMKKKWDFQFPNEWLDRRIGDLREQHSIQILNEVERNTGVDLVWSGNY